MDTKGLALFFTQEQPNERVCGVCVCVCVCVEAKKKLQGLSVPRRRGLVLAPKVVLDFGDEAKKRKKKPQTHKTLLPSSFASSPSSPNKDGFLWEQFSPSSNFQQARL
jgi:hypothetical protein